MVTNTPKLFFTFLRDGKYLSAAYATYDEAVDAARCTADTQQNGPVYVLKLLATVETVRETKITVTPYGEVK